MSQSVQINCLEANWKSNLKQHLQDGLDVVLLNFDYTSDGQLCEMLALSYSLVFRIDYQQKSGIFRHANRESHLNSKKEERSSSSSPS